MVYKVIGLMSGSSLDGLDIVYTFLTEVRGQWTYEIVHADCIPYNADWEHKLKHAAELPVPEFLKLNTAYGRYIGEQVNKFIADNSIEHAVHFIASHGHTVFHEPGSHTTGQIGDGATIAAMTGLPVICDLRALDVALGGQGAPIVPIGDKLLFGGYDYLLNIGGIANVSIAHKMLAFDVCPANQVLNTLAQKAGQPMDKDGEMAASGTLLPGVLEQLNEAPYYNLQAPKSLSNEAAINMVFPALLESAYDTADLLQTMVVHIAQQVANAIQQHAATTELSRLLITGGGALNTYLVDCIRKAVEANNIEVVVPDTATVMYKEAIVMALIGALRWREETNVLASVTGASRDSIGGALWMGHAYNGD